MNNLLLKEEHKKVLFDIFDSYCPNAEIWAYGSRVKGNAHEGSDLDLIVKSFNDDNKFLFELKEILNESNIPFIVDIHDYDGLPSNFYPEIEKNYVVLYSKK